jgi:hypothetical protein
LGDDGTETLWEKSLSQRQAVSTALPDRRLIAHDVLQKLKSLQASRPQKDEENLTFVVALRGGNHQGRIVEVPRWR